MLKETVIGHNQAHFTILVTGRPVLYFIVGNFQGIKLLQNCVKYDFYVFFNSRKKFLR